VGAASEMSAAWLVRSGARRGVVVLAAAEVNF